MTAASFDVLETTGLIQLAAVQPELEYLFRHVLVQDVTYDALPKQERRRLHAAVAETLEATYPDRGDELAASIGDHLEQAGEAERAVPYLMAAGRHAAARYAVQESHDLFDRVYGAVPADTTDPALRRARVEAAVERVKIAWSLDPFPASAALLEDVLPVAEAIADPALLSDLHYWIVFVRQLSGENPQTSAALARSMARLGEIGASTGDPSRARGLALAAFGAVFSGYLRPAVALSEQAAAEFAGRNDPRTASLIAQVQAFAYARLGDFAAADRAVAEALRLGEQADALTKIDAQLTAAYVALEKGEVAVARAMAQTCAVGSEELGATSCAVASYLLVGGAALQSGDPNEARTSLERSRQLSMAGGKSGSPFATIMGEAMRAAIDLMAGGTPQQAMARWEQAVAQTRAIQDRYDEALVTRLCGTSLMHTPDPDWAHILGDLETTARMFEEMEAKPQVAITLETWAQALEATGRSDEAAEKRSRASRLREEMVPAVA